MQRKNDIHEQEELKNIAPTLFSIKKEDGFSVPKNYFEALPSKIQYRVTETIEPSLVEKLWMLLNYKALIPATLVLVIGFFSWNYFNQNIEFQPLTSEEISMAILEEEFYVEEDLIVEALLKEDYFEETTSDDDVIEYLLDNDVDLSSIYDEM